MLLSTLERARSASRLKAHWRQHGPSCMPVALRVAGFFVQMEQLCVPGLLSSIANASGVTDMPSSIVLVSMGRFRVGVCDRGHRSSLKEQQKTPAEGLGLGGP